MSCLAVPEKGANEYAIKLVHDKFAEAGYGGVHVTLKSDQEPSTLNLKRVVAATRSAPTIPVETPVRQSKSNGDVERAIRTWQGQFRTMRHHLESRLKCKLDKGGAIMHWLISWAAELINKYHVQDRAEDTQKNAEKEWKRKCCRRRATKND